MFSPLSSVSSAVHFLLVQEQLSLGEGALSPAALPLRCRDDKADTVCPEPDRRNTPGKGVSSVTEVEKCHSRQTFFEVPIKTLLVFLKLLKRESIKKKNNQTSETK